MEFVLGRVYPNTNREFVEMFPDDTVCGLLGTITFTGRVYQSGK